MCKGVKKVQVKWDVAKTQKKMQVKRDAEKKCK